VARLDNFRLVVFRAVADRLSFRKAAEELYLTQPAVSLQIKALEEELGVQLFDRSGAQAMLTPAGRILLDHVRRSSDLLMQAEHKIAALSGDHAGALNLGASTTIAQYVLPRLLSEFCSAHPRVLPTLISGNTEKIVDALVEQKIVLGLIEGPPRSRDVSTARFLEDELVLVVPAAHEWAERGAVPLAEMSAVAFLMRERGSGTRRIVEMALDRCGIKRRDLRIVMELDSTEAIKSAVEAGFGAGFISHWAMAKDARLGRSFKIVRIEGLSIRRDFLVATLKGSEPQGPAQQFYRFLASRMPAQATQSARRRADKGN
jgi:DNA-binding transcriptional LysR family regulator